MSYQRQIGRILRHLGIEFDQQTTSAYNVDCPFCQDNGKHCGIFFDNMATSCWHCKEKSTFFRILQAYVGLTLDEYKELMESETEPSDRPALEEIESILRGDDENVDHVKEVTWPPEGCAPIVKAVDMGRVPSFMERRRLDLDECLDRDVHIGLVGKFTGRFVMPVLFKGKVVAFQARAMDDNLEPRYHTEGDISRYVYGIDDMVDGEPGVVVEGIFDSWRVGHNCVSVFTKSISPEQFLLLREKKPSEWIFVFDPDAFWDARTEGGEASAILGDISIAKLPAGKDPDDFDQMELHRLLYERGTLTA